MQAPVVKGKSGPNGQRLWEGSLRDGGDAEEVDIFASSWFRGLGVSGGMSLLWPFVKLTLFTHRQTSIVMWSSQQNYDGTNSDISPAFEAVCTVVEDPKAHNSPQQMPVTAMGQYTLQTWKWPRTTATHILTQWWSHISKGLVDGCSFHKSHTWGTYVTLKGTVVHKSWVIYVRPHNRKLI